MVVLSLHNKPLVMLKNKSGIRSDVYMYTWNMNFRIILWYGIIIHIGYI